MSYDHSKFVSDLNFPLEARRAKVCMQRSQSKLRAMGSTWSLYPPGIFQKELPRQFGAVGSNFWVHIHTKSNSMVDLNTSGSASPSKGVKKRSKEENFLYLRILFGVTLLISIVGTAYAIYYFLRESQMARFRTEMNDVYTSMRTRSLVIQSNVDDAIMIMRQLFMEELSSYPNMSYGSSFYVIGNKIDNILNTRAISFNPILNIVARKEFEAYACEQYEAVQGVDFQPRRQCVAYGNETYWSPCNGSFYVNNEGCTQYFPLQGFNSTPPDADEDYLLEPQSSFLNDTNLIVPVWQIVGGGLEANDNDAIMYVLNSQKERQEALDRMYSLKVTAVTSLIQLAQDKEAKPSSIIFSPISHDTDRSNNVVACLSFVFSWGDLFEKVIPRTSHGIYIELEVVTEYEGEEPRKGRSDGNLDHTQITSEITKVASYKVMDRNVEFIGYGDLHETEYDQYVKEIDMPLFSDNRAFHKGNRHSYRIRIYPSTRMIKYHFTNNPIYFSLISVGIFCLACIIFILYDRFTTRVLIKLETEQRPYRHLVKSLYPGRFGRDLLERVRTDSTRPPKLSRRYRARGHESSTDDDENKYDKDDIDIITITASLNDETKVNHTDTKTKSAYPSPFTEIRISDCYTRSFSVYSRVSCRTRISSDITSSDIQSTVNTPTTSSTSISQAHRDLYRKSDSTPSLKSMIESDSGSVITNVSDKCQWNDDETSEVIGEDYAAATVLFADIVGFTAWCTPRRAQDTFELLENLFALLDAEVMNNPVLFKVETIGDCYMVVAGVPEYDSHHAENCVKFALRCHRIMEAFTKNIAPIIDAPYIKAKRNIPWTSELSLRIGIHSGPVRAGILRGDKPRFQLFGDTVNTASRMESLGVPGQVHVSGSTALLLRQHGLDNWLEKRQEEVRVKGKGLMQTFLVAKYLANDEYLVESGVLMHTEDVEAKSSCGDELV